MFEDVGWRRQKLRLQKQDLIDERISKQALTQHIFSSVICSLAMKVFIDAEWIIDIPQLVMR